MIKIIIIYLCYFNNYKRLPLFIWRGDLKKPSGLWALSNGVTFTISKYYKIVS